MYIQRGHTYIQGDTCIYRGTHVYTGGYMYIQGDTCVYRGIHVYTGGHMYIRGTHVYTGGHMHIQGDTCIYRGTHVFTGGHMYIHGETQNKSLRSLLKFNSLWRSLLVGSYFILALISSLIKNICIVSLFLFSRVREKNPPPIISKKCLMFNLWRTYFL